MLIGQPNAEKLAEEIVARGLNVRQVEEMARQESGRNGKSQSRKRNQAEKRAPTRWRWKSVCPTRSAWSSASIARGEGASSASAIAISISSTTWRGA